MSDSAEHRKLCLYRAWWGQRHSPTTRNKHITYDQQFREMYGESLVEYHAKLREAARASAEESTT